MVYKIIWSPQALQDLRNAVNYIQRDKPDAARRFGEKLIAKAESLASFPERGRVIRKFQNPSLRETFLGPYRIQPGSVEIARLWHGARNEEELEL